MANDLNQCNFTGNLVSDCEQKFTATGVSCIEFRIATNGGYKDKTTGEWVKQTEYIPIKAWRKEQLAEYLKKGKQVRITGKFKTDQYEKDGVKKYFTYIEAIEVQLLGGRNANERTTERANNDTGEIPF